MGNKTGHHRRVPPAAIVDDAEPMLGFAGLVASGMSPEAAFDAITTRANNDPAVAAIVEQIQRTPEGLAALAYFRQGWAENGLPAPWENTLDLE